MRQRMVRWMRGGAIAGLLLVVSSPAMAQTIDLVNTSDLAFGTIVATPAGGTVTVDPTGLRTATGVFGSGASGFGAANFTVTQSGKGNPHYSIILPSGATLTSTSGSSMTVSGFQSDPSGSGQAQPPVRQEVLAVGATLNVAPNQQGGAYQGTFLIIVNLGN